MMIQGIERGLGPQLVSKGEQEGRERKRKGLDVWLSTTGALVRKRGRKGGAIEEGGREGR
jgi:hypothetical protein